MAPRNRWCHWIWRGTFARSRKDGFCAHLGQIRVNTVSWAGSVAKRGSKACTRGNKVRQTWWCRWIWRWMRTNASNGAYIDPGYDKLYPVAVLTGGRGGCTCLWSSTTQMDTAAAPTHLYEWGYCFYIYIIGV